VVTGIGSLIHIYSTAYMHEETDGEYARYFSYLNLFAAFMLVLVLGSSFPVMFVGWEGVGLCSYLLIGFWYKKRSAADAGKKAFVVNRIGDFGFILGTLMIFSYIGTLDFQEVAARVQAGWPVEHSMGTLTIATLLLFLGATGKSAQIPLYTWLPDAMEGPTPVSALIHAATMVTAGVYLIVRTHVLFENAWFVEDLAAALGAATLLMAGLIALVQVDIKRVIAYSTMSQIGYMFVGAGSGAYPNGMFHLMTHAFFKALLFLAAGIAIHALTGEQDIRRMRGLGRTMPRTRIAFLIGSLALVGVPPFAGFFSKDAILAATLDRGAFGDVLFACGIAGAFLTGVYTFRLFFIVFGREGDAEPHLHDGAEGPPSMVLTVGALAALSVVGGFLQFAPVWTPLTTWLSPVARPFAEASSWQEGVASAAAVAVGVAGIYVAYLLYVARTVRVPRTSTLLERKFYWDEAYDLLFYRPAVFAATSLRRFFEEPIVEGSIGEVTRSFRVGAGEVSRVQNGLVRSYVLALASGVAVLAVVFLVNR
jgi:NADH-quinone oxidoreductase subunit L